MTNPISQEQLAAIVEALRRGATVADLTGTSQEVLECLYALGHDLYGSANYVDAETVFRALCLYNPHERRYWMGLAGSRQGQEKFEEAIDAYQFAALATGLDDMEPLLYGAQCLLRLNRKPEAITGLEGIVAHSEKSSDAKQRVVGQKAQALLDLLRSGDAK